MAVSEGDGRAVGSTDPLDAEVVRSYWVGGPPLDTVDSTELLARLRKAFTGQVTGLLGDRPATAIRWRTTAFTYSWSIRGSGSSTATRHTPAGHAGLPDPLGNGRSVDAQHAVIMSRPLTFEAGVLALGDPWPSACGGARCASLAPAPAPGDTVSAHWDWLCGTLSDAEAAALSIATQTTLDLVNSARNRS